MAFETGCSHAIRPKDHEPWTMGSSLLLGIDGLIVDRVLIDDAGRRVVHCSTDPELAGGARRAGSSPRRRRSG